MSDIHNVNKHENNTMFFYVISLEHKKKQIKPLRTIVVTIIIQCKM